MPPAWHQHQPGLEHTKSQVKWKKFRKVLPPNNTSFHQRIKVFLFYSLPFGPYLEGVSGDGQFTKKLFDKLSMNTSLKSRKKLQKNSDESNKLFMLCTPLFIFQYEPLITLYKIYILFSRYTKYIVDKCPHKYFMLFFVFLLKLVAELSTALFISTVYQVFIFNNKNYLHKIQALFFILNFLQQFIPLNFATKTKFINAFIFQTCPMQFFYQVYQRTMVCTRKREKKRTKASSTNKRSPPAKRMRMETSATAASNGSGGAPWKSPGRETAESDMSRLTSRLEPSSKNAGDPTSTPVSTKLKISLSRGSVEDGSGKSGKKSPITATISRSSSNISVSSHDSGKKSDKSPDNKIRSGQKSSPAATTKQSIVKAVPTASPVSPRKVTSSSSTVHKTSNTKQSLVTSYMGKSASTTAKSSASQAIPVPKQSNASKTSVSKGASAPVKTVAATTTPKLTSILKNSGSNVVPVPQGILKNSNTSTVKPNPVTPGSQPPVKTVITDSSKTSINL